MKELATSIILVLDEVNRHKHEDSSLPDGSGMRQIKHKH